MIQFAPALAVLGTPAGAATVAIYAITGLLLKATLFPKKSHRADGTKRKYRKRRKMNAKKV